MIAGEIHDDGDDIVEKLNSGRVSVARVLFSSIFSPDGVLYLLVNSTVVSTYLFFFPFIEIKIFRAQNFKMSSKCMYM